jgi:hypothetical protein
MPILNPTLSARKNLFFTCMFLVPESPRWLAKTGALEKARRILDRIGGEAYARDAAAEMDARKFEGRLQGAPSLIDIEKRAEED